MPENGLEERKEKKRVKNSVFRLLKKLTLHGQRIKPTIPNEGDMLKDTYRVKEIVRVFPDKAHSLVSYEKGEITYKCFECGYENNIRGDMNCASCGLPLSYEPLLLSQRWDKESYKPFLHLPVNSIIHPNLSRILDLFEEGDNLYAVFENIHGEPLSEIPSPLPLQWVADMGVKLASAISYLLKSDIALSSLKKEDIIVSGEKVIILDPTYEPIKGEEDKKNYERKIISNLHHILREYIFTDDGVFTRFLNRIEVDDISLDELLRTMETFIVSGDSRPYPEVGALSDVGMLRSSNEDSWGWLDIEKNYRLFMVADGMGGHEKGEVASSLAIKIFGNEVKKSLSGDETTLKRDIPGILKRASQIVNREIKLFSEREGIEMGTTFVSALIDDKGFSHILNIGDSRAYVYSRGVLTQISVDHSFVSMMVNMGLIKPEEARNHPQSNILTRTIGIEWDVEPDIFTYKLEKGDYLILCSDGLWGEVEDRKILEILNDFPDPREACKELVLTANYLGGRDNITVLILRF